MSKLIKRRIISLPIITSPPFCISGIHFRLFEFLSTMIFNVLNTKSIDIFHLCMFSLCNVFSVFTSLSLNVISLQCFRIFSSLSLNVFIFLRFIFFSSLFECFSLSSFYQFFSSLFQRFLFVILLVFLLSL